MKTFKCNAPFGLIMIAMVCLWPVLLSTGQGIAAADQPKPQTTGKPVEKIHITAQRLISDSNGNYAEFIGDVKVKQGETAISSDSLKIFFSGNSEAGDNSPAQSLEKLVASGNVEIKFDNRLAVARQAVYITAQRMLILTGPGAMVTSGDNTITGETITFYRDDGRFTVEGGSNGRVKAVILPEESGLE